MQCRAALNFTVINNNDNIIQTSVTSRATGAGVDLVGATGIVTIYAPGTTTQVLQYTSINIVPPSSFWFMLTKEDSATLEPGSYGIVMVLTLADGTVHTVNNGDADLTTGIMRVVERPA